MGLFERIFGNRPKEKERKYEGGFAELNGYTPRFTSWSGELYEQELIRASINTLATHISKLNVEMRGSARPALQSKMKHAPNEFQTWAQFLARAATIYYTSNNLIITPVFDGYGQPSGIYTPIPQKCEIVQFEKVPFIRYEFSNGTRAAVELEYCAIMPRMQYKDDFFGESNRALLPTVDLIHMTNQGIEEGVKSAATYRFYGTISNFTKAEDLARERQRFTEENFSREAKGGGLLLFPNTYKDIKQIDVKPWVVDADQMRIIKDNVYQYFGVNEKILTNSFDSETWSAFYEGAVEPWAIQFSEVMTKMLFTLREQTQGNMVMATANRLQYMSNADKLKVSAQISLQEQAQEILAQAEKRGVSSNFFFVTTFKRYQVQIKIMNDLEKSINEHGATVTKEYVKGRQNLVANPAISEYNKTATAANGTVSTLISIIKSMSDDATSGGKLANLIASLNDE